MPSSNAPAQVLPAAQLPPQGKDELRNKLVWLTIFRVVATTLLMALLALRLWQRPFTGDIPREDSLSFAILGGVYVLNLIYGLLLRVGWGGRAAAYVQVMGDVVIASSLVYLSGGVESPFTITYALAVVAASILLQTSGAMVAASASSLALLGLGLSINAGILRVPTGAGPLSLPQLVAALSTNVLAQFLTAALASYLSRELSHTGGMLSAREEDLRRLDKLQRQILSCMPSGLVTCDPAGRVTFINRAGAQILGTSTELSEPPSNIEDLLPGVRQFEVEARRREMTLQTEAGLRVLGLTATPLDDPGALLVVFQDLTDLRRMQLELERADRLAALGKFSAQLAHEIRNPLAAMRGSAQMLAADSYAQPSSVRLSNILVRESDRLSRLVDQFLKFARPAEPDLKATALGQLVRETVETLKSDPEVAVVYLEAEIEEVQATVDPDQIRQVVLNLVRNAVQAAGRTGMVRVKLKGTPAQVRLTVWDSAGSIASENMARLFEPFFTTRAGGTGLGLSTAHAIVRAHHGNIEVTSARAEGTEFTVGLPHP